MSQNKITSRRMSVDSILPALKKAPVALPVQARRFSTGQINTPGMLKPAPLDADYLRRVEHLRESAKRENTMGYTTFHTKRSRDVRVKQIFRCCKVLSVNELTTRLFAFKYSHYEVEQLLALCKQPTKGVITLEDFQQSFTAHAFQTQKQENKGKIQLGHASVTLTELRQVARTYSAMHRKPSAHNQAVLATIKGVDLDVTMPMVIRTLYPNSSDAEIEHAVDRLQGNSTPSMSCPTDHAKALFHAFDVDDSGLISMDEVAAGQLRHVMPNDEAAAMFQCFDEDNNCLLSEKEFTRFYMSMRQKAKELDGSVDDTKLSSWLAPRPASPRPTEEEEQTLEALFKSYDTNQDGLLQIDELRSAFKGVMTRAEVHQLAAQYHADATSTCIDFTGFKRMSAGNLWGDEATAKFYQEFFKGQPQPEPVPLVEKPRDLSYSPKRPQGKLPPLQVRKAPTRRTVVSPPSAALAA